ncbi:phospho-N-acetylmuramoyl-pentapeptide-transferase [Synechococcus sp. PCC 7335]|uniref:phospho-N-acetylmuramoyl-pentapeptide- transferase n=1 Tax=Synechococcus sp. (strain ATCC 29403 / PCC 7335) TaxID=91464 RepID=UPI00017ECED1|nr:phospho-N-acetylmuramoyl-pentapeptide-transferase [Synechococcus sp. PCC 7335]EDX86179.1 phospho-N-acetylmuramoyl-pentapeptide-transferase [Synechococcus sp. PCC 7335]
MDARFLPKSVGLSGVKLSILLAGCLLSASIGLDLAAGRSVGAGAAWSAQLSPQLTGPLVIGALLSALAGSVALPILKRFKAAQFIREDGPSAHLKKAGTPTMGGIFFIPVAVLIALVWTGFSPLTVAAGAMTLAYGLIGWIDDWQVMRKHSNKGISPKAKLILQIGFAIAFCFWAFTTQSVEITTVALPLGLSIPLGFLFWPLASFVLVAESNATNLTDGVDGLMSGAGAIAFLGLGALVAPTYPDLMVFCATLSGSCLGFLAHNRNPAKVFMGDTGSLALGGALAAVGILSHNLFGLLIVTLLFVAETLSVLLQVGYYKATKGPDGKGKRLFRMAPLHHHFELSGWSELQVVGVFYMISALLATIAISTLR